MTKLRRSLISAAALVVAALLTGFADGPTAEPVDCRVAKCVALTFDGGPGRYTAELLDLLAEERVPATFFLIGKGPVFTYPELVRRMADEGHEVGNHSWTHPRLTEVPVAEARRQLVLTQDAIEQVTGRRPTLMRPPQGRTNAEVAALCKELGLAQILWNSRALDWREHDPKVIEERILKSAKRGGVVLLHDIYEGTVPAVPGIVKGLRERGFTLVSVERLFAPGVVEAGEVYRHA
ncbi:polysaccharide deacetylase family protein [Streptomyces sp. NBC_00237]|uniref:polysaccharide deacetylase family protein n=1 Tax=Streptomyces sp. NBC_00237 TaxID=2975687 RepID=UPI00224D7065|nr:polysaccharide deacetylase family protein [Streptomyces sp. NBC_00237]MCX5201158.1 polysaccharide deacetylase family protein [Streptomyces sp. NBC_00237]